MHAHDAPGAPAPANAPRASGAHAAGGAFCTGAVRRPTLLVADDEPDIVDLLREYFEGAGFDVLAATSGEQALAAAAHDPDLVLLDVDMPGLDGYETCRRLRGHLSCPILFLTARVEDVDQLEGFEAGADDYVLKPFSLHTLGARVRAHLAREERRQRRASVRFSGDVTIDYAMRSVTVRGVPVDLTRREFDIAAFLSKHPGQAFDRDRIHEQVGGWENESDPQVVTEHVRRIRRKLAEAGSTQDPIETVWGLGYRWRA